MLCDTIEYLLALEPRAGEIVIVDQTRAHPPDVAARLQAWNDARCHPPDPARRAVDPAGHEHGPARGRAARTCSSSTTTSSPRRTSSPRTPRALARAGASGPWSGRSCSPARRRRTSTSRAAPRILRDLEFRFNHDTACDVQNVMAGNLSRRPRARARHRRLRRELHRRRLPLRDRLRAAPRRGRRPHPLRAGGLHPPPQGPRRRRPRMWGDHRTSASPAHSVGDYYFARRHVPRVLALRRPAPAATTSSRASTSATPGRSPASSSVNYGGWFARCAGGKLLVLEA